MEWPRQLLDKVEEFEGFVAEPYLCPAGYWTQGYGTLCKKEDPPITREEAERLLIEELDRCYEEALIQCPVLRKEPEYRAQAIAVWMHNLGSGAFASSTFKKKVNARLWYDAAREMIRWTKATVKGQKVELGGLVRRRFYEASVFLNGA